MGWSHVFRGRDGGDRDQGDHGQVLGECVSRDRRARWRHGYGGRVSQCHEKLGTEKICQQLKVNLKTRANSTDHGSSSRQVISKEFPLPMELNN